MTLAARISLASALGVASIATVLLAHPAARAQTAETIAEALFLQGQERMAAQDITAACDLFTRSLKMDPALGTLLNLARCHERQGKTACSAEFAEAEASLPSAEATPSAPAWPGRS